MTFIYRTFGNVIDSPVCNMNVTLVKHVGPYTSKYAEVSVILFVTAIIE
jgi:hypothetical protein